MITYEERLEQGLILIKTADDCQFALGDLGSLFIEDELLGVAGTQTLVDFAHALKYAPRRMQEYTQVSRFYLPEFRAKFDNLRWTHYRDAMRYCQDIEEAMDALEFASAEDMNTIRFCAWLKEHKTRLQALKLALGKAIRIIRDLSPTNENLEDLERILHNG